VLRTPLCSFQSCNPVQQVRFIKKLVRVILTEPIPKFGEKGEEKLTSLAYARNTLFPHRLAVLANDEARKAYEADRQKIDFEGRKRALAFKKFLKKISALGQISIKRFRKPNGEPFSDVTAAIISEKIYQYKGVKIDPSLIKLEAPIRAFGGHSVFLDVEGQEEKIKIPVYVTPR